jgi:hypothetical protein
MAFPKMFGIYVGYCKSCAGDQSRLFEAAIPQSFSCIATLGLVTKLTRAAVIMALFWNINLLVGPLSLMAAH